LFKTKIQDFFIKYLIKLNFKEIELCEEGQDLPDLTSSKLSAGLSTGLSYAYPTSSSKSNQDTEVSVKEQSLEDLMRQLKKL
jgi:hypothetical protein